MRAYESGPLALTLAAALLGSPVRAAPGAATPARLETLTHWTKPAPDTKGRVTLVLYYAKWTGVYANRAIDVTASVHAKFPQVPVVAVDADGAGGDGKDHVAEGVALLSEHHLDVPIATGEEAIDWGELVHLDGIPTLVLVGADGTIASLIAGWPAGENPLQKDFEAAVAKALAAQPAPAAVAVAAVATPLAATPPPAPTATPVMTVAPTPVPTATPPVDAQVAQQAATKAASEGRWADALLESNRAVAAGPQWSEAVFVRAGIHVGLAGADAKREALERPRSGVDYPGIAAHLGAAVEDLQAYLRLEPAASDRAKVLAAIAELRQRIELANADAKAMAAQEAKQRADAAALLAKQQAEAAAAAEAAQAVRFVVGNPKQTFTVSVETGTGTITCEAPVTSVRPCVVHVPAGRVRLHIGGASRYVRDWIVPPGRTVVTLQRDARHPLGIIGGSFLAAAAGIVTVGQFVKDPSGRLIADAYAGVIGAVGLTFVTVDLAHDRKLFWQGPDHSPPPPAHTVSLMAVPIRRGAGVGLALRF